METKYTVDGTSYTIKTKPYKNQYKTGIKIWHPEFYHELDGMTEREYHIKVRKNIVKDGNLITGGDRIKYHPKLSPGK